MLTLFLNVMQYEIKISRNTTLICFKLLSYMFRSYTRIIIITLRLKAERNM